MELQNVFVVLINILDLQEKMTTRFMRGSFSSTAEFQSLMSHPEGFYLYFQ
jgi:hypothetical protein